MIPANNAARPLDLCCNSFGPFQFSWHTYMNKTPIPTWIVPFQSVYPQAQCVAIQAHIESWVILFYIMLLAGTRSYMHCFGVLGLNSNFFEFSEATTSKTIGAENANYIYMRFEKSNFRYRLFSSCAVYPTCFVWT